MFRSKAILGSGIAISVLTTVAALAAYLGGEEFNLSWYTIDGGGEMFSTGGDFELSGTIGQPDAGVLTGGEFTLSGGFWNSFEAACSQDLNGDNDVGSADLANLLDHWGPCPDAPAACPWDINGDGSVGPPDLANLLDMWGSCL